MHQFTHQLTYNTHGRKLYDVTSPVTKWTASQSITTGLLTLYIQHTSASLLINENYDSDVLEDLQAFFNRLVPDGDALFIHTAEGPDDMPAHVRSALTQTSLSIPVRDGKLALGQWQGIFLFEHRHVASRRNILFHLIGD